MVLTLPLTNGGRLSQMIILLLFAILMLAMVSLAIVLIMLKGKPCKLFLSMLMPILNRMVDELTLEIRHTFHHASRRSQHLGVSKTMKRSMETISDFSATTWLKQERPKLAIYPHQVGYCDLCAKVKKEIQGHQQTINFILSVSFSALRYN